MRVRTNAGKRRVGKECLKRGQQEARRAAHLCHVVGLPPHPSQVLRRIGPEVGGEEEGGGEEERGEEEGGEEETESRENVCLRC
jgi:hypothetical protein